MKTISLLCTVLISAILVLFPPLLLSQTRLTTAPVPGEARTALDGFCCSNGRVISSSQAQCKQKRGQYNPTRAEALKHCKPNTVFCCINGKVSEVSPEQCKRSQGTAYRTGGEAKRNCRPEAVYCCLKGKIKKVSPKECSKVRGTAYTTAAEAMRKCKPEAVYCCLKGSVKKISAGECKTKKGEPFRTEREARKNCGWCCAENKVFSSTPDACKRKKGDYFISKIQADQQCNEQTKCCAGGKLFTYSQLECKRKNGTYYHSYEEAKKQCQVVAGNLRSADSRPEHPLRPNVQHPQTSRVLEPPKQTVLTPAFVDQQQIPDLKNTQVPGTLQWPSLVDLAIIDISIKPSQPRFGINLIIVTTIKNIGLAAPQKNAFFQMEYTDDPYNQYLTHVVAPFGMTIPMLEPNVEHIITESMPLVRQYTYPNNVLVNLQEGNYKVRALINTSNFEIDEDRNIDNNEMLKTFFVRDPAPSDLVIDTIDLTQDCRLRFKFHNEGAAIPDPDFDRAIVSIEMGDSTRKKELSIVDPTGLSKHSGTWMANLHYVIYTWPASDPEWVINIQLTPGQTANFTVELNSTGAIYEGNITNNIMTKSLTCP